MDVITMHLAFPIPLFFLGIEPFSILSPLPVFERIVQVTKNRH